MQSPIDIRDGVAKKGALPVIAFDYKPSPLTIIDNGHTVQVDYAPGSFITVQGKRYELVQFHFHKPSEEKINGKSADMVAHLVHKDADGNLAVVAVLLKTGQPNKLVETLWKNLPPTKEKETTVAGVQVNATDLLPPNKAAYYTFTGSLTTPPCSEGVTWFVLKSPSLHFQPRSGPLRTDVSDERSSDATSEWSGDSRDAVSQKRSKSGRQTGRRLICNSHYWT